MTDSDHRDRQFTPALDENGEPIMVDTETGEAISIAEYVRARLTFSPVEVLDE